MREIKFRAWDGVEKRMYEVKEIKFIGLNSEPYKVFIDYGYQVEEPILMQYTNLKDKNGKEIYEGDIVIRSEEPSIKAVIEWDEDICGFNADLKYEPRDFMELYRRGRIEIIGNIYENPNLLSN